MNSVKNSRVTIGRVFRWLAISVGVCLLPIVALAVVAVSCLRMDGDSRALRNQVMTATGEIWDTKVQLSAGRALFAGVGAGLHFVDERGVDEAKIALKAVHWASVGVYERTADRTAWSRRDLFEKTDTVMTKRGWTRAVGVADGDDTVLIYTKPSTTNDSLEVCLAVLDRNDLVIASASVDAGALAGLVEMHAPKEMREHLKVVYAKL
jgi:hypothetical protein